MSAPRNPRRLTNRFGMPTTCGVKKPDGRECPKAIADRGACDDHQDPATHPKRRARYTSDGVRELYAHWLERHDRSDESLPDDLEAFLTWWDDEYRKGKADGRSTVTSSSRGGSPGPTGPDATTSSRSIYVGSSTGGG